LISVKLILNEAAQASLFDTARNAHMAFGDKTEA
jgi:hypothetical protein